MQPSDEIRISKSQGGGYCLELWRDGKQKFIWLPKGTAGLLYSVHSILSGLQPYLSDLYLPEGRERTAPFLLPKILD